MTCVSSSHAVRRRADASTSPHLPPLSQWKSTRVAKEQLRSVVLGPIPEQAEAPLTETTTTVVVAPPSDSSNTRQSTPGRELMPPPPNKKILEKSPMSLCIATIMGAAEHVSKEDVLVAKRGGNIKPNNKRSSKSKKSSRRRKNSSDSSLPPSPLAFTAGPFDPIEEQLADEVLYKQLVLTLALDRPHTAPNRPPNAKVPPRVIDKGFFWKDYPHIENVLYEHMQEYYELSINKRQSTLQQAFNNALVNKVRQVAQAHGNEFDPFFCDDHSHHKKLRDRIRCFYKTHLQNAKKRLNTIQKHLDRKDNRDFLQSALDKTHNPTKSATPLLVPSLEGDDVENEEPEINVASSSSSAFA